METVHSGYISDGANPGLAGLGAFQPGDRTLRLKNPYMKGPDVRFVQRIVGVTADGIFGPQTNAGVIQWQKNNGLFANGIISTKDWEKLTAAGSSGGSSTGTGSSTLDWLNDQIEFAKDALKGDAVEHVLTPDGQEVIDFIPDAAQPKKSGNNLVWWIGGGAVAMSLLGITIAASGDNK